MKLTKQSKQKGAKMANNHKMKYPVIIHYDNHKYELMFPDLKKNQQLLVVTADSLQHAVQKARQAAASELKNSKVAPKPSLLSNINIEEIITPKLTKANVFQATLDRDVYEKGLIAI